MGYECVYHGVNYTPNWSESGKRLKILVRAVDLKPARSIIDKELEPFNQEERKNAIHDVV
jgi:hypothetical protein